MPSGTPVLRFAPSPNGHLHLGHAYSAIYTWNRAQELGARFLLRIEDIDLVRCSNAFVDQVLDDLAWLGLRWEQPVRRQSEHFDDFREAVGTLDQLGVLYPCFATRKEIREAVAGSPDHPLDPEGAPVYPGISKTLPDDKRTALLASKTPHSLRIDMAKALEIAGAGPGRDLSFQENGSGPRGETGLLVINPMIWGDVVIARKDVPTSYHLSVVIDDALQGVTHVTRGQDLFYTTPIHRLLQVLLDLPEPAYEHHGLIRDDAGRRLSKSARDRSILSLRNEGHSPEDIYAMIGLSPI